MRAGPAVVLFVAIAGCVSKGPPSAPATAAAHDASPPFVVVQPDPEPAATQDELAVGGFLFANMCAKCHGRAGPGVRGIAISRSDYAGIRETITRGTIVYGGNMPSMSGILSPDQIDDVTKYILASQRG
ncbi:MAG: c-type cytochrome [Hyphomonadaceae bacterium]|nr:c-type cytochrome [Hyphomonadaceae bacterium]